jgi:hypothetical protein
VALLLQDGKTPLHQAAYWGYVAVVGQLLGAGAAVDAADDVRPPLASLLWHCLPFYCWLLPLMSLPHLDQHTF